MSDLVGNPKDRFSHNEAEIKRSLIVFVASIKAFSAGTYSCDIFDTRYNRENLHENFNHPDIVNLHLPLEIVINLHRGDLFDTIVDVIYQWCFVTILKICSLIE